MLVKPDNLLLPTEDQAFTLSEPAIGILNTCVNAAGLGLNLVSALHEQALLETFLPLALEVTFLAAVSLVLANAIIPNIADSVLIDTAKVVLEDMGQRGNIPAASLKDELDDVRELTSNLARSFLVRDSRSSAPVPPKAAIATIIRDGQVLSDAIVVVVEGITSATIQSAQDRFNVALEIPGDTLTREHQWPQLRAPESLVPMQTRTPTTPQLHGPLTSPNAMPQVYLDGIDAMPNPFPFDTEDLRWLDLV
ncbi:hypothetical protein A1O3_09015 [Capronia epimyces CBS 606.96]|uniref:Uncharacterized protein n=1 Tax=Capronia epimyces CBS 606.96 TaxID=1182542 RepID=W9XLN1_9EURO|nr:uncharacterized protein A1O3_09015 [Capronia epimyces CBS 606.96]EXJ77856.1 hypothetical protein A1O3_09015 [Capronia epimyces CBS 606.96]